MTFARRNVVGVLLLLILAAGMAIAVWGGLEEGGEPYEAGMLATTVPMETRRINPSTGASTGSTTTTTSPSPPPPLPTQAPPMPTAGSLPPAEPFPAPGTTSTDVPRRVPGRGTTTTGASNPPDTSISNPQSDIPTPVPTTTSESAPTTTEPAPTTTTTEPPPITTTTEPPATTTTAVLVILGEPCPGHEGARGLATGNIPCVCLPDENGRARWVAA